MNLDVFTRGFLTLAAAIMFALVGYALWGDHKFTQNIFSMTTMFVLPTLVGIGLLAANLMPEKIRVNLMILIASFVIMGYLAELVVWSVDKTVPSRGRQTTSDVPARLKKLIELRREGKDIYAVTSISKYPREGFDAAGLRVIPLGYISNSSLISCGDSGEFPVYETDRYGFFNPPNTDTNETTIALVGDSLTESTCVEKNHNLSNLISNMGKAVLNFGRNGNGPVANLAIIREYVSATKPKYVFWLHSADTDIADLYGEKNHPILARYFDPDFSQNLRSRQKQVNEVLLKYFHSRYAARIQTMNQQSKRQVPRVKTGYQMFKDAVFFRHIWRRARPLARKIYVSFSRDDQEVFTTVLSAAQFEIERWGGKLVFVYLPGARLSIEKNAAAVRQREWVLKRVAGLGIPIVDLLPVINRFSSQEDVMFPVRPYPHFNETGYRLIGEEIIKYVEKKNAEK
jgi:hypothetical protein